jgi:hypothetical protein
MKRTTLLKDTVATYNDELAVIMAAGDATTIEEASSNALAECDGGKNVFVDRDALLGLVHNQAPPPTTEMDASQNLPNAPHAPSGKARLLSHESHDNKPGTQGCDDDVTSINVATSVDVRKRRSYLEVLTQ